MKKGLCFILLFFSLYAFAQKEANNWIFGVYAGMHFEDDGSVTLLQGSKLATNEGSSSISDTYGNLLFYTDGQNVWDRNHIIMPNADYENGKGLLGDPSSAQSAIIVPNRNNPNQYYIFTIDEPHHNNAAVYPNQFTGTYPEGGTVPGEDNGYNDGLNYSIVDISVTGDNGSIGDVITKNLHLITYNPNNATEASYKCSEKLTAVKNNDGSGYWVITQFIDKFYAFEITPEGVNETPVISTAPPFVTLQGYRNNAIGCLKVSPNGKKIVIAHQQMGNVTGEENNHGSVWLYDFNSTTGVVSNSLPISQDTSPYGVEFSRKSRKLYVSYGNGINQFGGVHQYDLLSGNIPASDLFIAPTSRSGTLQLAPNGKIYRAATSSSKLDIINFPEESGFACGFASGGITLTPGKSSFGLPNFISSYFFAEIISRNKCFGDITEFQLDSDDTFTSITWNFGDGSPTTPPSTNTEITHQYPSPGKYTVRATITAQGDTYFAAADIIIAEVPVANIPNRLTGCDENNDGITEFNLSENTPVILGSQSNVTNRVTYFASESDALANTNVLALAGYENSSNPQTIYARVQNSANSECYNLTSFTIQALTSPVVKEAFENKIVCIDSEDGLWLNAMENNAADFTYKWSPGNEETVNIQVFDAGLYTVTITNALGCETQKQFVVTASGKAIIEDIIINDLRENNVVTIVASAPQGVDTKYTYSIDRPNGPFTESNVFEYVSTGLHTVYVHDTNGCGITSEEITVLSFPKFFTPNGDDTNETWNIAGINAKFYPKSKIYIFNRYGKLLADVDPKGLGWNGMFESAKLPADDYWFVLELDNGRIAKGHFSLIR
ncbi:hypothetical protein AMR72_05180 [Flavobacterium psychrophilum]|nr:hypothetical protein AMR72_05180 [Flavobacterium psychrophilum]AOE51964.1 hypothetical protein ALW18_05175 [Flavobacterium psychrophilum]